MLPFIVGVAAGAVAVVSYNNNKEIRKNVNKGAKKVKEVAESGFEKTKEVAQSSFEKTKEIASDVKVTVEEKIDCLKGSKEEEKNEK